MRAAHAAQQLYHPFEVDQPCISGQAPSGLKHTCVATQCLAGFVPAPVTCLGTGNLRRARLASIHSCETAETAPTTALRPWRADRRPPLCRRALRSEGPSARLHLVKLAACAAASSFRAAMYFCQAVYNVLYTVKRLACLCYCLLRCYARCMSSTATCKLRLLEGKPVQSWTSHIASKFRHSEALRTASHDCRQTYLASQGHSHLVLAQDRSFLGSTAVSTFGRRLCFFGQLGRKRCRVPTAQCVSRRQ